MPWTTQASGSSTGTVDWTFAVADQNLDFLDLATPHADIGNAGDSGEQWHDLVLCDVALRDRAVRAHR